MRGLKKVGGEGVRKKEKKHILYDFIYMATSIPCTPKKYVEDKRKNE